jgi:hypothetical protein
MSILNRRNALLGWGVWKVGKVAAKRKAMQAVQPKQKKGRGKGAILPALAAAGGAVWFWRRRRSDGEEA